MGAPKADDGWQDIATFDSEPKGLANSVLIAIGTIVGEAYYRSEGDSDDGWWWAGTSPGDYYSSPIVEINNPPTHWRPLPAPPLGQVP